MLKNSQRQLFTKVKTARGRKVSSTKWLQRQLNDPYVAQARVDGYRSRAAYKLIDLNDKFNFLKNGHTVIDLGCAPGGWLQVAEAIVKPNETKGNKVIGIDLQEMPPIDNTEFYQQDFMSDEALVILGDALNGQKADVVLSDMAASACGHAGTDHIRIISLCEAAFYFAVDNLKVDGTFAAKILRGGTEGELLNLMKHKFTKVKHFKPESSRKDSSEMYVVAMGFKGR